MLDTSDHVSASAAAIIARFAAREATVGIIGLGYVGLPLAIAFCDSGVKVLGFDIDPRKTAALDAGESYIKHIASEHITRLRQSGQFEATSDLTRLDEPDALLICVPTPLTPHRTPDLTYVIGTSEAIARRLRRGQLVVLESTTFPGTTRDIVQPILEREGLRDGADFFLAFSPEREDPGNTHFSTARIPKVVGADNAASRAVAHSLYAGVVPGLVEVSNAATAEAVKITENVFRAVNIALVNELKIVFGAMGIDVWEVIEAARTKPFGFMPFYPGPGLGGHCIPIDPFYLTWKAREYNEHARLIELAGEINSAMPEHVVRVLADALDERFGRGLRNAAILVLGVAYKKNVDDLRESPSLRLIHLLERRGAVVAFHDPHVRRINETREYPGLNGREGVGWDPDALSSYDAVLIATDHDAVDYCALAERAKLIVDTRNACARAGASCGRVVRA